MNVIFKLFFSFMKIGYTSFGGTSMIPLINSEMEANGWMNLNEISDIVAIAEMTPGPLGLNCATFAGMRVAGILGAFMANLGVLMPTFTICAVAAFFFEKFHNNPILKSILYGVRPVGIGIICAVVFNLMRTNYFISGNLQLIPLAIGAISFFLLLKFKWSVPKVIGIAALIGLIFCR